MKNFILAIIAWVCIVSLWCSIAYLIHKIIEAF